MKIFLMLFIGLIIGAGIVFLMYSFVRPGNKNDSPTASNAATQQTPMPSPATMQTGEPNQQKLNQLRQQYQQQGGLPLTATVDTVYSGIGFIMRDTEGNRIFVHWTSAEPTNGEQVTVIGRPAPVKDIMSKLQNQSGYTSALGNFLQNQQYFVEATSVNPSSNTTGNPSMSSSPSY